MSFDFGSERSPNSLLTQMGLMNLVTKFSTGNPIYDALLWTAVPLLATSALPKLARFAYDKIWTKRWKYTRHIVFRSADDMVIKRIYGVTNDMDPPPTSLLQQALLSAMNKRADLFKHLSHGNVQLGFAPKNTSTAPIARANTSSIRRRFDPFPADGDGAAVQPLQLAAVTIVPEDATWVEIESGLFFRKYEFVEPEGEHRRRNVETTFSFGSNTPNGNVLIDDFIKKAFEEYQKEQRAADDSKRYLYIPVDAPSASVPGSDDMLLEPSARSKGHASKGHASKGHATPCKRYALAEEKTFDTFFHPDKDSVLKLVNDFLKREGKFAIHGYPRKLGFLLHGPPGTGKTSFIKALAQYTRRNIVSIPLALIETNQALMDIMFNQQYAVPDQQLPVVLPFDNTIYVLEDVDAAGDVVLRRTPAAPDAVTTSWTLHKDKRNDTVELVQASSSRSLKFQRSHTHSVGRASTRSVGRSTSRNVSRLATASIPEKTVGAENVPGEEAGEGAEAGEGETIVQTVPEVQDAEAPIVEAQNADVLPDVPPVTGPQPDPTMGMVVGLLNNALQKKDDAQPLKDALNLSGLLNALDGVVDTPGRIIVMTSNHPEKLDPALTRPGRINRHIYLGRLKYLQALQMTQHYFPGMTEEDKGQFTRFWVDECWTPAELEAVCGQCDEMSELLGELQARTGVGRSDAALFDEIRQTSSAVTV